MSRLSNRVDALLKEWTADRGAFAECYPHIPITLEFGRDPHACAMESIAEAIGGDDVRVMEIIGGPPVLIEGLR